MAEAKSAEQQRTATLEVGDFQSLLKKEFRPKTDRAREHPPDRRFARPRHADYDNNHD